MGHVPQVPATDFDRSTPQLNELMSLRQLTPWTRDDLHAAAVGFFAAGTLAALVIRPES